MAAIQDSRWEQIILQTWEKLSPHLWEDFRLALMEAETEQDIQGVIVKFSKTANEILTESDIQGIKVVFSPTIISANTNMIVNIVVSERDYKSDMVDYLPIYERKSDLLSEVLTAYDREFRGLEQSLEVADRNIFLDTAVESLPIYERDLGIQTVKGLRYDQRREQISSRNRASFDQTTEETIKNVASAYSNGEVEINKTSTPGIFEIKFVGTKGIPDNMDGLKKALDIISPAHLELTFTYTFNTWEFLRNQTWGNLQNKSWNDIQTWDEVS
jgi:hypothetical protein